MRVWLSSLFALSVLTLAASAWSQDEEGPPTPGVGELTEGPSDFESMLDAGVGFSRIDEDSFIDFNLGFSFSISKLTIGLSVPLRFRVIDEDPQDDEAVRSQDWDEPSDFFRVLRFVQWGNRHDTVYVRGGELVGVTMGHGTIVNGYNNVVDVNHFQWGLEGAVNLSFGGFELLLDNLANPEIMGLRTYFRPWAFIDPESFWTKLAFGLSFVGDIDAPTELLLDAQGLYIFDDERNIVVEESEATGILGVDAELQVFTNDLISVTPYTDFNFHLAHGFGFHLGTFTNFTFSQALSLNTRLEFRALQDGYEPEYFDGLYEVERFLFRALDPTEQRRPKLQFIELQPPDDRVGFYGEGTLSIIDAILITLAYQDYQGADNARFLARLSLPQLGPVVAGAYFLNQNFDGFSELFDLDHALLVAEARAYVYGPVYVIGQYARRWAAQEDGTYEPVDDWGVGLGVTFGF